MDEPNYSDYMRPRMVCLCRGVTHTQLVNAIRAGAHSLATLQKTTGAATGCGTCAVKVMKILHETLAAINDEANGQNKLPFAK